MSQANCDVFLSYRRSDGSEIAQVLRHGLEQRGYRVFLDVRDQAAGPLHESIEAAIHQASDFVLVLTPDAVVIREQNQDWLVMEIQTALAAQKNICPVVAGIPGFEELARLPQPLGSLKLHHAISYSHEYCDAAIDRLCRLFRRQARPRVRGFRLFFGIGRWRTSLTLGISLLAIVGFGGLTLVGLLGKQVKAVFSQSISAIAGQSGGTNQHTGIINGGTNHSTAVREFENEVDP